jgi:hypothetical protein
MFLLIWSENLPKIRWLVSEEGRVRLATGHIVHPRRMMMMRRCGFLAVTLLIPFVLATESTYVCISGMATIRLPGKTSHNPALRHHTYHVVPCQIGPVRKFRVGDFGRR